MNPKFVPGTRTTLSSANKRPEQARFLELLWKTQKIPPAALNRLKHLRPGLNSPATTAQHGKVAVEIWQLPPPRRFATSPTCRWLQRRWLPGESCTGETRPPASGAILPPPDCCAAPPCHTPSTSTALQARRRSLSWHPPKHTHLRAILAIYY